MNRGQPNQSESESFEPDSRYNFDSEEQRFVLGQFYEFQKKTLTMLLQLGFPIYHFLTEDVLCLETSSEHAALSNSGQNKPIGRDRRVNKLTTKHALDHKMILDAIRENSQLDHTTLNFCLDHLLGYDFDIILRIMERADDADEPWFVSRSEANEIIAEMPSLIKSGNNYRQILIESNAGLVFKAADIGSGNFHGLTRDEIFSAGNAGLTKAINRWSDTIGCSFSTLAYRWIKATVNRYIQSHSRTIRIPSHIYERYYSLRKVMHRLGGEGFLETENAYKILSEETGYSTKIIADTFAMMGSVNQSLHESVGPDGEGYTLEEVCGDNGPLPDSSLAISEVSNALEKVLEEFSTSNPAGFRVLSLTYGLSSVDQTTTSLVEEKKRDTLRRLRLLSESFAMSSLNRSEQGRCVRVVS